MDQKGDDMVAVQAEEVTMQELGEWYKLAAEVKELVQRERMLRMRVFRYFFPDPREGMNTHELPDGYALKAVFPYTRNIDTAVLRNMGDQFEEAQINADAIVRYVPELVKSEYNKLTEEQKLVFDLCLVLKPGSPSITITAPAKLKST